MLGGLDPLHISGTSSPLSLHSHSTNQEESMGTTHLAQSTFGCVLMLAAMIALHLLVQHEFSKLAFIKLPHA